MTTSRQSLLQYIRAHRVVTAAELSRALRMTPANARHHLAILEEQGLVEIVGQRPPKGRGRPSTLYSLSDAALGQGLDHLASALLGELLESRTPAEQDKMLKSLAWRLSQQEKASGGSLTRRLYQAMQQLNDLGYQARWEARPAAPQVILGHCPYAAILDKHPELCRLDGALLEALAGAQVRQTAKQETDLSGARYCIFVVGK